MSAIATINGTDVISTSRTTINTNFSNLNTDKMETSVLDTDNTLASNSDAKIPSQKAVKTYVDAGGNVNASTTSKGIVEEATSAEITAATAAGATGARLFINPTAVAETGADKIVKIKSTGLLDSSIVPNTRIFTNGTTTKNAADASATQNIAHGLGTTPKKIKITAHGLIGTQEIARALTVYNGTTQSSIATYNVGSTNTLTIDTTFTLNLANGASNTQTGVVTFDATNIIITWTKTGSPTGTYTLLWEAEF